MHISTRTTFGKSRRIERARYELSPSSWSMSAFYIDSKAAHPHLVVSLDGQDGKTYSVGLDERDIETLVEAFEKYRKQYPAYFAERRLPDAPSSAR